MGGAGRKKSIAFFISLGVGLIVVTLLLYVGWVLLDWRTGILLFLGIVLLSLIIAGVVLNTIFLVREIRRNEQHDAFINAVTHELKTPVASIRLYAETLLTRDVDEAKRTEFYRIILEDSDRLLATVEQVLRTGRAGHASRKPLLARTRLDEVVDRCVGRARKLHRLPQEALEYQGGPALTVLADTDELEAAVSNLLDNAVKYSGAQINVKVEMFPFDEKSVAVRVKDTGVGIPKTEMKRIFRRFYRIPSSVSTRVKGTGLGLYLVRLVARRHGGRVWAESEGPGCGSTFTLQLPLAK